MSTSRLKLAEIATDAGTQAREGIDEQVVADYAERMEEGDQFPAVIAYQDGSTTYLADGFHRVMAASRIGYTEIDGEIRKGTREDALWYALGANRKNGQRPNRGDVQHAVELALNAWPDRTQQAIAEQVGCSQGTVAKVKAALNIPRNNETPATITNTRGQTRPTSYRKHDDVAPHETEDPEQDRPLPTLGPPRNGISFARIALMKLREIRPDDTEREKALAAVQDFLDSEIEPEDADCDERAQSMYAVTIRGRNIRSVKAQLRTTFGSAVLVVEKIQKSTSRSARLGEAEGQVESAKEIVQVLQSEMEEWRENMPDNLQDGVKAEEVGDAANALEEIVDALDVDFSNVSFPGMFS